MVDQCTKNKFYVFPPKGGNSNWSKHFAVQHKGLKKVIVGDKKTGSETEQLKNTLDELEKRGKEVLKKFFMLKRVQKLPFLKKKKKMIQEKEEDEEFSQLAQYKEALWLVTSARPSTVVEDKLYKDFLRFLNPRYGQQSRMSETRKEFDLYVQARLLFQQRLEIR